MAVAAYQTADRDAGGVWRWPALPWFTRWLAGQRDQLILWLPVALGAGIAAWFMLPSSQLWLGWIMACGGLALTGWALAGRIGGDGGLGPRILLVGGLALAAGCALAWVRSELVAAPVLARPVMVRFAATIVDIDPQPARDTIRLMLVPARAAGLPPRVRVSVPVDTEGVAALSPGDSVALRARLVPPPPPMLPGAYDFARRAWFERIGAVGSALGPVERLGAARERGPSLRNRLFDHIRGELPPATAGIAAALVTGSTGGIAPEDNEAMRRAGLAHLLSISGLHVSAAIGGAMWLALRLLALVPGLALRRPLLLWSSFAGALVGIGYTLLTGAEVPTVRSLIAALLVLAALALGREALSLRLVAAGAFVILLFRPEALVGPSFQLSFAAIAAIVALHSHQRVIGWFQRREESLWRRLARGLVSLLLTGLVVELALLPIALFHFHRAGLYGSLANIIAIPLTTLVIMPAEALALVLDMVGLGAPAWWVVDRALALLLAIAHAAADAPGAVTMLPTMPVAAFALAVAGGLWCALVAGRSRWLGAPLIAGAILWAALMPDPDLLISGDGRHVASRMDDGAYRLLRDRAGDYVREQMGVAAGVDHPMAAIDAAPGVRCSPDFCVWRLTRGGRLWTILAARSSYRVDWVPLVSACAQSDIVIAERRLPRGCRPRWLRLDRAMLSRSGGMAITLAPPRVSMVASDSVGKPWADPPTVMPPRSRP